MSKKPIAVGIKFLFVLGILSLFTVPFAASATDQTVYGGITGKDQKQVPVNEQGSVISLIIPPPVTATVINFDDKTQPCGFVSTIALTTKYMSKGVIFSGPGGKDGGAVLNQCSNFVVTNYSPPNFLAFRTDALLSNGGIPKGPETIIFNSTVSHVQINAGGETITMTAYDGQNVPLGSVQITGTAALQTLLIQKTGIKKVVIQFTGGALVLDDLAFLASPSALPSVSIATDKTIYSPGSTMIVSGDIKNPTTSSVTADVNVYLKSTDIGLNKKMASARLTMAPGFDRTITKSIPIGNLGSKSFNATWYIEMRETVSPFKLISDDSATWKYLPARSYSELKPEDIGNALAAQFLN